MYCVMRVSAPSLYNVYRRYDTYIQSVEKVSASKSGISIWISTHYKPNY